MIKTVYIFLILFISILFQVEVGTTGFVVPFTVMSVAYLSVIFSWKPVIIPSLIAGGVIDLLYGRDPFFSPILFLVVLGISLIWLYKGNTKMVSLQFIPGFIVGLIYIYPSYFVPYQAHEHGTIQFLEKIGFFIGSLLLTTILFPCFIYALDKIARAFALPVYSKSKERVSRK